MPANVRAAQQRRRRARRESEPVLVSDADLREIHGGAGPASRGRARRGSNPELESPVVRGRQARCAPPSPLQYKRVLEYLSRCGIR